MPQLQWPEHEMKQDSFQYLYIVCSQEFAAHSICKCHSDDVYSKAVIMKALLVWLTLNHQLWLFKRVSEEEKNI